MPERTKIETTFPKGVKSFFIRAFKWFLGTPPKKKSFWKKFLLYLGIFLALIPIRLFVIGVYIVPTSSMYPTIKIPAVVFGNIFPRVLGKDFKRRYFHRGDIVIFKYPPSPKVRFVKRIIGLPGEYIKVERKVVYISKDGKNWTALMEPYAYIAKPHEILPPSAMKRDFFYSFGEDNTPNATYRIPDDHYFLMGDNRDFSYDSRFWGPIDIKDLYGKATLIYWAPGASGFLAYNGYDALEGVYHLKRGKPNHGFLKVICDVVDWFVSIFAGNINYQRF